MSYYLYSLHSGGEIVAQKLDDPYEKHSDKIIVSTINCSIGFTRVGDLHVSTVFLGVNHAFMDETPVLFETMVFPLDSYLDEYVQRYHTYAEAKAGHVEAVRKYEKITGIKGRNMRRKFFR